MNFILLNSRHHSSQSSFSTLFNLFNITTIYKDDKNKIWLQTNVSDDDLFEIIDYDFDNIVSLLESHKIRPELVLGGDNDT
jgi:hypothetical protein